MRKRAKAMTIIFANFLEQMKKHIKDKAMLCVNYGFIMGDILNEYQCKDHK